MLKILKILFKNTVHSCNLSIQEAKQEDKLKASLPSLMRLYLVKQTQNKQQQYDSKKNCIRNRMSKICLKMLLGLRTQ